MGIKAQCAKPSLISRHCTCCVIYTTLQTGQRYHCWYRQHNSDKRTAAHAFWMLCFAHVSSYENACLLYITNVKFYKIYWLSSDTKKTKGRMVNTHDVESWERTFFLVLSQSIKDEVGVARPIWTIWIRFPTLTILANFFQFILFVSKFYYKTQVGE